MPESKTPDSSSKDLRLSEFIALLHHEVQQTIEYLSQQDFHKITDEAPSASLVKIENMQIEIPVQLQPQIGKVTAGNIESLLDSKSFILKTKYNRPLEITVKVLGSSATDSTKDVGKLKLQFSVASK